MTYLICVDRLFMRSNGDLTTTCNLRDSNHVATFYVMCCELNLTPSLSYHVFIHVGQQCSG